MADEAAAGPVQLDQEVEERFLDRLGGGEHDEISAIGATLDRGANPWHRGAVFNARLPKLVGRSDPRGECLGLAALQGDDLYFGTQRLPQTGQHGEPPEPSAHCH
ncbi:MAG TPA: hypothetical protein VKC64_04035 [Burkholderiales bacterium]|nr:hypothetical protein [Burkholderiales bacterium]